MARRVAFRTYTLLVVVSAALFAIVLALSLDDGRPADAAVLPPNFVDTRMLADGDLQTPTAMAFAPDGRLFVLEQRGRFE
jgi:hypothetical protein